MKIPWLLAALLLGGCGARGGGVAQPGKGTLSAQWAGGFRGSINAPAAARWCVQDTLLEIMMVRNDTAVGFSLLAQDSVRPGPYPINGSREFSPARPQSSAALRWLGEFDLRGYQAMGGQVIVTRSAARTVSGTFDVTLRPLAGKDSIRMAGAFERLPIVEVPAPCGRANRPGPG